MNVLHVTPCFAPAWAYGGVARAVTELARAQVALGHTVSVLTTDALAPHERLPPGEVVVDGVHVYRVPNISGATRTWLGLSTPIGMRRHARTELGKGAMDIVHLHELRTVENLSVIPVVPETMPVVVSPHGTLGRGLGRAWARRAWDSTVGNRLLARVDRLVAHSDAEAIEIRALYSERGVALRDDQVAIVPNGHDLSAFETLPARASATKRFGLGEGPVVLFHGRLSERNRIGLLLSAFAQVQRNLPTAQLLVAGPDHGALSGAREQVRALGLDRSVLFPGYLSGDDTRAAFAAADVCALPAIGEGFPLVGLDALACGVPVLLGPDCNYPSVAGTGAGQIVPLMPAAWAEAILLLLRNSDARDRMGERARVVATQYTWPSVASTLQAVYECGGAPRRAKTG